MRISDWSSDVCSSDLADRARQLSAAFVSPGFDGFDARRPKLAAYVCLTEYDAKLPAAVAFAPDDLRDTLGELAAGAGLKQLRIAERWEEHTSELQSLMRNSYAVVCLKKKKKTRKREMQKTT